MSSYNNHRSHGRRSSQQGASHYNSGIEEFEREPRQQRRSSQTPRTYAGDFYESGQRYPHYPPDEGPYENASQQTRPRLNSHGTNYTTAPQSGGYPYQPPAPILEYQPTTTSTVYPNLQTEDPFFRQPRAHGPGSYYPTSGPSEQDQSLVAIPRDPPGLRSTYIGIENSNQSLDPRYVVQTNPRAFFKKGRVFSVLWHESPGANMTANQTFASQAVFPTRFGQNVYSHIRRMVVVKEHAQCAWCFAIYTYHGRGVSKYSADAAKHSIVFTEGTRPMSAPDEPRMSRAPLEIRPVSLDQRLDPMSRLNFSKLFTVEYNVKVLPVGKITEQSMPAFLDYARQELSIS